MSQCSLCWSRQLESDLADDFRLIALDLRGHGRSGRPVDGYGDSRVWADDVDAVIGALRLEHPVLSGWSYGPLVILDYIRHYGDQNVGALQFVGAVTRLGSDKAAAALTPEFLSLVPGLLGTEVDTSVRALDSLLRLCFGQAISAEELFLMLGYNVSVSPAVRQAMLSRVLDNDDIMRTIRRPVLITHGALDRVVRPAAAEEHRKAMPHAQVGIMSAAGHVPFWEQPAAFNRQLREFADAL